MVPMWVHGGSWVNRGPVQGEPPPVLRSALRPFFRWGKPATSGQIRPIVNLPEIRVKPAISGHRARIFTRFASLAPLTDTFISSAASVEVCFYIDYEESADLRTPVFNYLNRFLYIGF